MGSPETSIKGSTGNKNATLDLNAFLKQLLDANQSGGAIEQVSTLLQQHLKDLIKSKGIEKVKSEIAEMMDPQETK